MFNVSLLFFIQLTMKNRRMSYAVAMNMIIQTHVSQENPRESPGITFAVKTIGSKMLYREISCPCYAI